MYVLCKALHCGLHNNLNYCEHLNLLPNVLYSVIYSELEARNAWQEIQWRTIGPVTVTVIASGENIRVTLNFFVYGRFQNTLKMLHSQLERKKKLVSSMTNCFYVNDLKNDDE